MITCVITHIHLTVLMNLSSFSKLFESKLLSNLVDALYYIIMRNSVVFSSIIVTMLGMM